MQNKKIILIVVFSACIALVALFSRVGKEDRAAPVGESGIAPQLQIADAVTGVKLLSAELQGKVLLVNVWASWCQPCKEEMPSLEALHRAMAPYAGFRMITILYKDAPATALDYMKSEGFTFPVYADAEGVTARNFGVTGVPETFIIDKQGRLVKKVIGGMDWNSSEVKDYLQALLKQ